MRIMPLSQSLHRKNLVELIQPLIPASVRQKPGPSGASHPGSLVRASAEPDDLIRELPRISWLVEEPGAAVHDRFRKTSGGGSEHGLGKVVGLVGHQPQPFPPNRGGEHGPAAGNQSALFFSIHQSTVGYPFV